MKKEDEKEKKTTRKDEVELVKPWRYRATLDDGTND